jgi:methyl-accepting chemotaxis protein
VRISKKLNILTIVTVIGLGLIIFFTITGLNKIEETQNAAHRRQAYTTNVLEIKANALATIMLDPSSSESKEIFSTTEKLISQNQEIALKTITRPAVRDELNKIQDQWRHYLAESQKLIALASSNPAAANQQLVPLYEQVFKPYRASLETFIQSRQTDIAQGIADAHALSQQTFWEIVVLSTVVALINVSLLLGVAASLQTGLKALLQPLKPLQQGDLTQRMPANRPDELGEIAAGINDFVKALQGIVRQTRENAEQLSASAVELAAASASALQSTSQQSDSSASVAASVEQFSASIEQVSDNATEAENKASQSGALSQSGGDDVRNAIGEIRRIEQVVSKAAFQMNELGQQAHDISSIVNVIKEVADQTNLLALNAAIEAARAGEQGRGFAVVADEVRNLAKRTSSSAQEITNMVMSIQQSTNTASNVMQEGNALVIQSVQQIENAGQSMQQINASSGSVVSAISEISAALREQRTAGAEIAQNVERIAQMTESGRQSASEVSFAAQQLAHIAEALQQDVARFKV